MTDKLQDVIIEYEKQALIQFWQWASFPENKDKVELLRDNKEYVEAIVTLAWSCFCSSDGRNLQSKQLESMMETVVRK